MAVDVNGQITVSRTRREVAEVMFNPKYDKVWISGVVNAFPLTPGKLTKGSRVERVGDFLNKRFSSVFEVIRAEDESFVEMSSEEPFQLKVRYSLSDAEDGTLVEIRLQSVGELPFSMPATMLSRAVKEMISRDLKRLKKLVEEIDGA